MPLRNIPGHTAEQIAARGDVWRAELQGNLIAFAVDRAVQPEMPNEKRGKVGGFTMPARLRMLKTLARIDWEAIGASLFVTLTYPDERKEGDYGVRTSQRSRIIRFVERSEARKIPALWRIEWKPRQSGACIGQLAPHVHICFLGLRFFPWRSIRAAWGQILSWENPVTHVMAVKGRRAAAYAAKYAAKPVALGSLDYDAYLNAPITGRHWGLTRKALVPRCPRAYKIGLERDEEDRVRGYASELLGHKHDGGFVVLAHGAHRAWERIFGEQPIDLDTGEPF